MVYACQAIATMKMPSPSSETAMPVHRSRKSRRRSGAVRATSVAAGTQPGCWFARCMFEAFDELGQDLVELVDLAVVVGRGHLDPETHLGPGTSG